MAGVLSCFVLPLSSPSCSLLIKLSGVAKEGSCLQLSSDILHLFWKAKAKRIQKNYETAAWCKGGWGRERREGEIRYDGVKLEKKENQKEKWGKETGLAMVGNPGICKGKKWTETQKHFFFMQHLKFSSHLMMMIWNLLIAQLQRTLFQNYLLFLQYPALSNSAWLLVLSGLFQGQITT